MHEIDEEQEELARIYEEQNDRPPRCQNCDLVFTLYQSGDEEDCYVFALDEKDDGFCSYCSPR